MKLRKRDLLWLQAYRATLSVDEGRVEIDWYTNPHKHVTVSAPGLRAVLRKARKRAEKLAEVYESDESDESDGSDGFDGRCGVCPLCIAVAERTRAN